MRSEQYSQNKI